MENSSTSIINGRSFSNQKKKNGVYFEGWAKNDELPFSHFLRLYFDKASYFWGYLATSTSNDQQFLIYDFHSFRSWGNIPKFRPNINLGGRKKYLLWTRAKQRSFCLMISRSVKWNNAYAGKMKGYFLQTLAKP
jgi:hypothetical protein